MKVEVSNGEIVDKMTILMIKSEKTLDTDKLENITREIDCLSECVGLIGAPEELFNSLMHVNRLLWDVEDRLRECEADKRFDSVFIDLARSVYSLNDRRARIKREINIVTNSMIIEEKVLPEYDIV